MDTTILIVIVSLLALLVGGFIVFRLRSGPSLDDTSSDASSRPPSVKSAPPAAMPKSALGSAIRRALGGGLDDNACSGR